MAKLVIFTSGTLGDHLPYLALARGLQRRGHEVLMVINQAMHAYAERVGVKAVSLTDVERGPEEARENAWAWDHWRNPLPLAREHRKAQPQTPAYFIRQIHELAAFVDGADLFLATAIRPHGLAAH
ncbi:MAG: glycosyltransferase, partial [Candidatus Promineifilaceae bacterium]